MPGKFTDVQVEAVTRALENPKFQWRTVSGLAAETGLPRDTVAQILEADVLDVVRSSAVSQDGEALYTTRTHFRKRAPLKKKFLGALKNRAD